MIKQIKSFLRPAKEFVLWSMERVKFTLSRFVRRVARTNTQKPTSQKWVVLCVKKPIYAKMVRDNINSLHRYNKNHRFTVVCDNECHAALTRFKFDYPRQVEILNRFAADTRPWQFQKIDALKLACSNEAILVDADTIWWEDPVVNDTKIIFQVSNKSYFEWEQEKQMLLDLVGSAASATAKHFVTGFVRIPKKYWNEKLEKRIGELANLIWNYSGNSKIDPSKMAGLKRLCEEIAIGYTVQEFYQDEIETLKTSDPYNDRNVMQSLYYGAINRI